MKGIVQEIQEALKEDIGDQATTTREIQDIIKGVLCEFYPKHIDSAPEPQRGYLDVALLLGVWVAGAGSRLFETSRTKVTEVDDHYCVGLGAYLARYVTDLFFPPGSSPSVEETKPLAAYIVGRAREYVEGCGGNTFVRALLDDGMDDRVWNEEIADSEDYFAEFFKTLGSVCGLLNCFADVADIDMAPYAKILKDRLVQFTQKQKGYRDLQVKHRAMRRPTQPE